MGGKKRQRLRVEQCPECGIMSNLVLLKPEVCGCRAREVPDHGGWASSISLWGASGCGSRGVEARRLVWGEAIVIGPSISCSKGGFLLGNWFFYLNDHFFLAACLDPLGPECWVWGRSRWALNWSKTTSLIRFAVFSTASHCIPQVWRNSTHFCFPWEAECQQLYFSQGYNTECYLLFWLWIQWCLFSVSYWQMICSWTINRLKAVFHLLTGARRAPLGAQQEKGFLLDPITAAQLPEGLINPQALLHYQEERKARDSGIRTWRMQRVRCLSTWKPRLCYVAHPLAWGKWQNPQTLVPAPSEIDLILWAEPLRDPYETVSSFRGA